LISSGGDVSAADELAVCERQLRRAGLPLLIEGYSATEDVFTRALPFLVFVAFVEVLGAIKFDWPWWLNALSFFGGLALLLGLFGVFNRWRGRPFFALPRRLGLPELAAFVLIPSLLPVVFGGQVGSALGTMVTNLMLVGLVWLVIGFGLLSIVRWAGARLFAQLTASLTLMVRALPLILFFGLLSFFATEIWQIFNTISGRRLAATVLLFVLLGLVFLVVRLPNGVKDIEGTVDLAGQPLSKAQRVNLSLVILVSQALQILLVSSLVWLFFCAVGALLVDVNVVAQWTGKPADPVFTLDMFGGGPHQRIVVTEQLLRAAFGIAAFSGLYYSVAMLVDATYRDEFMSELTDQMRSTFTVRAHYLALRSGAPPPVEHPVTSP
jgi:hypothetical protein